MWLRRCVNFRVTRNGEPIEEIRPSNTIRTGIEFETIPGTIPLYDELEACRYAGYKYWHDWQELTPLERARLVAHYYLNRLIEAHKEDAVAASNKRKK